LWRGFAVEPKPGDWSLMRHHILHVICSGVVEHGEYLLNWIARLLQHPNIAGEVAIVLRGGKGVGKGILGRWIAKAFGQHGIQIFHSAQLVGRFNEHLRDCVFLFADEAFYAGDKQHEGALKGLVTEPFLPIEGKYQRVVLVPNMLHLILASNNDWVIPASSDERRYCALDVADTRCGDLAYFAAIEDQMRKGGLAAMLHDLLARDISGFEVRQVPQTEALRIQKTLSLNSLEQWWLAVLSRGFIWKSRYGARYFREWHEFYSTELLHRSYSQWCRENRPRDHKSREALGKMLGPLYQPSRPREAHPLYELEAIDVDPSEKRGNWLDKHSIVWGDHPRGYLVGSLEEARIRFSENCDVSTEWGSEP
jgi:phage/plasmid-associated DNA primase